MKNTRIILTTLAGAAFAFGGLTAQADDALLVPQAKISIEQAIAIAVKATPGTVVSAGIDNEMGQLIWEVEILTDNKQVMELDIDAKDGTVIKQKIDRD